MGYNNGAAQQSGGKMEIWSKGRPRGAINDELCKFEKL